MGIVVWKSVIKHACAPHAHICAHLSQRQSHSYLLQPNHLTEVFVATKQLGIIFFFCSYQAFNGFGEMLESCCHWLQNTAMPENSVIGSCVSIHCLVCIWGFLVFIHGWWGR